MEIRVLEYFLAVAREQNITAAAEALHISQPALSRQLKNLEEELGKQLLIRGVKGSRKVLLTEEGMILRKRAEEILELVENASSRKSKSEEFITKFARIYTPAVVYSAVALAVIPPLVRMLGMGVAADWGTWVYRALTFLVISCPCALVISIPLSFFAGIGGASNAGVLVKGSNYLETLSQTKCVVFDKTGTMTKGEFALSGIHHAVIPEEELLAYAAYAEANSTHPISKSIQEAYGKVIDGKRYSFHINYERGSRIEMVVE